MCFPSNQNLSSGLAPFQTQGKNYIFGNFWHLSEINTFLSDAFCQFLAKIIKKTKKINLAVGGSF